MRFTPHPLDSGTDMDDLVAKLDARDRTYLTVPVSELELGDDGLLRHGRLEPFGMTRLAAHRLGSRVGIPGSYIDRVPNDIAAYNFNQFMPSSQQTVQLVIEDGALVGVLPQRAHPVDPAMLVDQLQVTQPAVDFARWDFSPRGLRLRYLSNDLAVEPRVGDLTKVGVEVWDYENEHGGLGVHGAMERLVCTNGMTVPVVTFTSQVRRELWREPLAVAATVAASFQEAITATASFGEGMRQLAEMPLCFNDLDGDERDKVTRAALKVVKVPSRFAESVTDAFIGEDDETLYGFLNANTRLGRDAGDMETKQRFERAGFFTVAKRDELAQAVKDTTDLL